MNKTDTNWAKNQKFGGTMVNQISESVESNDPTISTMLHNARVESIRKEEYNYSQSNSKERLNTRYSELEKVRRKVKSK